MALNMRQCKEMNAVGGELSNISEAIKKLLAGERSLLILSESPA